MFQLNADGTNMYQCKVLKECGNECNAVVNDRSSFQRHLKVHSPEMPYWCYVCGTRMKEG